MSLLQATFGVSWKVASMIAGIIFLGAAKSTAISLVKAAILAAGGAVLAGGAIYLLGMGIGYLVSKFNTQSNLSMW